MTLVEIGRTSLGRPWQVALVSSPANLAGVEKYRDIALRLASPEGLTDDQARQLARDGKAIVHIDGGLHASEVAGAQHTIQLAYDLVSGAADPKIAAILDNVILMLWPSLNPDGQTIVADWYRVERRHAVRGGAAARAVPALRRPRQQSRRVHAQHDRVAGDRPHLAAVGAADHLRAPPVVALSDAHLAAAVRRADRDAGAADHVADGEHDRHGDRAEPRGARPGRRDAHGHRASTRGIPATSTICRCSRTSTRSGPRRRSTVTRRRISTRSPTTRATCATCVRRRCTRARGAADGGGSATPSTTCSPRRCRCSTTRRSIKEELLYNRYQAGRDQIRKYEREPPFAYFIAERQRDPVAAVELLRRLAFNGVRVHQLSAAADSRRRVVSRRHVGHRHEPAVRGARAAALRRAGLSGSSRVSGGPAGAAVRRGRLDAAAADGRAGRSRRARR